MRSTAIRHLTRLRLTLVDAYPPVTRTVAVDQSLTLAELNHVVQAVFDSPACGRHLFTNKLDEPGWTRERRRWGDRWTMIDFRDPTVIDETTARIDDVLCGGAPLYFAHTCEPGWVVEVEAGAYEMGAASDPPVRIIAGERRSPFACSRGPYEHEVLLGVLKDVSHPDHTSLRLRIEATVGPWATFEPEDFDPTVAQRLLNAHPPLIDGPSSREPLAALVRRLPTPARAGLRAHIAAAGIDLPVVVTADEAERITAGFRWLIERTTGEGVPIVDGAIDPVMIHEGVEVLGAAEDEIRRLLDAARQLRLVYTRKGRLVAKKIVSAIATSPTSLWSALADALASCHSTRDSAAARDLFLLALVDGSLTDAGTGLERSARAFAVLDEWPRHSWAPPWSDYSPSVPGCEQHCDCPEIEGTTWHDIVATSIRDATASATSAGAATIAAFADYTDRAAAGVRSEWVDAASLHTYDLGSRRLDREPGARADAHSDLLDSVTGLVDVLSLLGLEHSPNGAWIVPPTLREFARAVLQSRQR